MNNDTIKLNTPEEIQRWQSLDEKSSNLKNKINELSERLDHLTIQINEDNEDY
jgi:DNA repair ATPase RecN